MMRRVDHAKSSRSRTSVRYRDGAVRCEWREIRLSSLVLLLGIGIDGACGCSFADERLTAAPSSALDERANRLADEVFASDDFWWKRTERVESPSFLGRVFGALWNDVLKPAFDALLDLLGAILEWLLELGGLAPSGDWSSGIPLLWALIAGLGAIVVWRIVVMLRRQPSAPATPKQAALDELPQAERLLEQAQAAIAAGDHRAGLRLAFLALIAHLQQQGKLVYDSTRSNREYHRDLRPWPDLSAGFRTCAEPFERCWYGGHQPSPTEVNLVLSHCRRQLQITAEEG